jgi:hypothetical protein
MAASVLRLEAELVDVEILCGVLIQDVNGYVRKALNHLIYPRGNRFP